MAADLDPEPPLEPYAVEPRFVAALGGICASLGTLAILGLFGSTPLAGLAALWRNLFGWIALAVALGLAVAGYGLLWRRHEDPWELPWGRGVAVELVLCSLMALLTAGLGPFLVTVSPGGLVGKTLLSLAQQVLGPVFGVLIWLVIGALGIYGTLRAGRPAVDGVAPARAPAAAAGMRSPPAAASTTVHANADPSRSGAGRHARQVTSSASGMPANSGAAGARGPGESGSVEAPAARRSGASTGGNSAAWSGYGAARPPEGREGNAPRPPWEEDAAEPDAGPNWQPTRPTLVPRPNAPPTSRRWAHDNAPRSARPDRGPAEPETRREADPGPTAPHSAAPGSPPATRDAAPPSNREAPPSNPARDHASPPNAAGRHAPTPDPATRQSRPPDPAKRQAPPAQRDSSQTRAPDPSGRQAVPPTTARSQAAPQQPARGQSAPQGPARTPPSSAQEPPRKVVRPATPNPIRAAAPTPPPLPPSSRITERDPDDLLFEEAQTVAQTYSTVSPSLLQRKLRIGYTKACDLLERLQDEGFNVNWGSGGEEEPRRRGGAPEDDPLDGP